MLQIKNECSCCNSCIFGHLRICRRLSPVNVFHQPNSAPEVNIFQRRVVKTEWQITPENDVRD